MFELAIVTPTSNRSMQVSWLGIETMSGDMVIQKGHAPLIAILKPRTEIRFETQNGMVESMDLTGGIVEVRRNSTLIIVD